MFTKSIRWRLQLWQGFLLVCILSGFGVTAYQLHRLNRFREIDSELERRLSALATDARGRPPFLRGPGRPPNQQGPDSNSGPWRFEPGRRSDPDHGPPRFDGPPEPWGPMRKGSPPPPDMIDQFIQNREIRLSPQTQNLFSEAGANDFYYTVWNRVGKALTASTNAPQDLVYPEHLNNFSGIQLRLRGHWREALQFTEIGECVLVGRSMMADLDMMRRFAWVLGGVGAAVLALGLGGGWVLASRALRPVEQISATASRMSSGNLAERINIAETDSELGRLAAVLNSTFARLEGAFAQQRQFTADASHELRTPLTVMISEAQSTLARERTSVEYRQSLETCLEAAREMKRLTQALLELASYDAGQTRLERRAFNLAEIVQSCIDMVSTLARQRGIAIQAELRETMVFGDEDRLAQVVTNLLANAIQYNKDKGKLSVATRTESGTALLIVADTGLGIPPQDLPHVFERFYRSDRARTTTEGHTGLGLAICKAIVEAHGGAIEVASQVDEGTTFTVRLPGPSSTA